MVTDAVDANMPHAAAMVAAREQGAVAISRIFGRRPRHRRRRPPRHRSCSSGPPDRRPPAKFGGSTPVSRRWAIPARRSATCGERPTSSASHGGDSQSSRGSPTDSIPSRPRSPPSLWWRLRSCPTCAPAGGTKTRSPARGNAAGGRIWSRATNFTRGREARADSNGAPTNRSADRGRARARRGGAPHVLEPMADAVLAAGGYPATPAHDPAVAATGRRRGSPEPVRNRAA